MTANRSVNIDWYPGLSVRICGSSMPDSAFVEKSVTVTMDFDTGASHSLISERYLIDAGLLRGDEAASELQTAFFGAVFSYYEAAFKVALIGESGATPPAIVPLAVVVDFEKSGFLSFRKDRKGLLGRDILHYFNATIELDFNKLRLDVIPQDWNSFEIEVANLFRQLGIAARRNFSLAGNQIDVLLNEQTASGKILRTIVECKFYKKPVGIQEVRQLKSVFDFSKSSGLADHAILVSSSGFSKDAYLVAETSGLELLEIEELRSKVRNRGKTTRPIQTEESEPEKGTDKAGKLAFVMMPFRDDFRDIYMLGIRETLSNHGYTCTRVDEVEFVGRIMDKILDLIKSSDIVIAEVTEDNPNVYYEVGIAHALNKNVVLCTKESKNIPFDIRDLNHIIYSDIVDLRSKLEKRLRSLIEMT
ncbi:MAG: hypothetical protein CVU43_22995 [Chloroflexi bacterium HGW-Chloroflexi-5]|jgi:hypothetical protein|nr:MAG: hypothetical protein CVU43_22995 [Chloroflexi bacterium HGW-Chloroflexi-5]